ncbi:hypothetical protein MKW98_013773, partial [Papaver atlanticum]
SVQIWNSDEIYGRSVIKVLGLSYRILRVQSRCSRDKHSEVLSLWPKRLKKGLKSMNWK